MRGEILYNFSSRRLTLVVDPTGPCNFSTWKTVADCNELVDAVRELIMRAIMGLREREECREVVDKLARFLGEQKNPRRTTGGAEPYTAR